MAKRFLCLLLAALLLAGSIPFARADILTAQPDNRTLNGVYITIWQGSYQKLFVYEYGEDILFRAEDLARLSTFDLTVTDQEILFTRGSKTVHIHLSDSALTVMDQVQGIALNSPVQRIDGSYYLSASSLLPWLNMKCTMEDGGILRLVPNLISYWDEHSNFDLKDYQISLSECAEALGITTKDAQALAYAEKSFSGKVIDFFDFSDVSTWTTTQYYNLFDDFFRDQSATENAADQLENQMELLSELIDVSETFITAGFPELEGAFDGLDTMLTLGDAAAKYYNYCVLFDQDNSAKLTIMESLINNTAYRSNKELCKAAKDIKATYEDFWDGTLYNLSYQMQNLTYKAVEEFTSLDLLKQFKINYLDALPENELMKRYSMYEALADIGLAVWEKGCGSGDYQTLVDLECHAMLNLYATEQCYRAMAQHAIDTANDYSYDALYTFRVKAYQAERQYARFLAMLTYAEYDDCDYDTKEDQAERYMGNFFRLKRTASPNSIAALAEQAIYLAALQEMGIYGLQWDLLDLDGDGTKELLAQGEFQSDFTDTNYVWIDGEWVYSPVTHYVVLDGYTLDTQYYYPLLDANGPYPYLLDFYNELDSGTWYSDGCYYWSGSSWVHGLDREVWLDYTGTTVEEIYYYIQNEAVSENAYNAELDSLAPGDPVTLTNPDLLNYFVSGDRAALLSSLDAHFEGRENMSFSISKDLDGDGIKDRLYGILNAAQLHKDYAADFSETMTHYTFTDRALTLVAAVSRENGIQLRTCRISIPYSMTTDIDPVANVSGQTLSIAGQLYRYQETGAPYTTALLENDAIASLFLGQNLSHAESLLQDYREWEYYGIASGVYDGIPLKLTTAGVYWWGAFEDPDAVASVEILKSHDTALYVVNGIWPGMSSFDFSISIFPATSLSPMTQVADVDGETLLWYTDCYYLHEASGNIYRIQAYFADEENRPLLFADAILCDEVPENIRTYFNSLPRA